MKVKSGAIHRPALLQEAIKFLRILPGKKYIDATVGGGGHAGEIIKRGGVLLGIDWDKEMLAKAKFHLRSVCPDGNWRLRQGNFARLKKIAQKEGFFPVRGIIFDLGLAADHYRQLKRGFSFNDFAPLDMRIGKEGETLKEKLMRVSPEELEEILEKFAQEPLAKVIAQEIVRRRKSLKTAADLGRLVEKIYQEQKVKTKLHPATKVFLALRIWVNEEGENLKRGLEGAWSLLEKEGRLVVISFHSGEDRLVKMFFKKIAGERRGKIFSPVFPGKEEVKVNPLARSAILRCLEKI